jgi:hypothetical protein
MTSGVHFKPGDTAAVYAATTFGLLVSPDGCRFYWLCEDHIGFGGAFDPTYAVTRSGAILATTFHGLRVSRDGGCSFATVTSSMGGAGDLSSVYFDAVDVSATGEVCVGSSDTPPDNAVFCSTDDAVTFDARGGPPSAMWYRSVKFAPNDANRLYASAYLIGGPDPDGGEHSPTAHLFRSDDDGAHWTEQQHRAAVRRGHSETARRAAARTRHRSRLSTRDRALEPLLRCPDRRSARCGAPSRPDPRSRAARALRAVRIRRDFTVPTCGVLRCSL